jgi:hypothetical protein
MAMGVMDIHSVATDHLTGGASLRALARREHVSQLRLKRLLVEAGYTPRTKKEAITLENKKRTGVKRSTKTMSDYQQDLRKRKRKLVLDYKVARGCSRCPENHPAVLDMHHRDPDEKHDLLRSYESGSGRGRIGGRGWGSLSYADIEAELVKCDVLCSNCHRKETWEARTATS